MERWEKVGIFVRDHETVTLFTAVEQETEEREEGDRQYKWTYSCYGRNGKVNTYSQEEEHLLDVIDQFHDKGFWAFIPVIIDKDHTYWVKREINRKMENVWKSHG
ncbi:hypothetical protein P4475_16700 [Halalkalibacterium halodurans]|uniref:hypothetical protein n=1 Tax=Halalkalibacterium halodurans TaxID=86665 RepID=UPI002E1AB9B0|nr:hypothetical protein [Halalkalibacterium halodurans]